MRLARITRVDGKTRAMYDRGETAISALPPGAPAAVLLYDGPDRATAQARVLAFDLDAKKTIDGSRAGRRAAAQDAARLARAVRSAGGRCIVASGPTGGHHVWIPLAEPLPLPAAAALAHALQQALPTLDPAPLSNAATGCMRPPGSPHASGGYQALHGPLAEALAALDRPNTPQVVEALWSLVPDVTPAPEETNRAALPETRQALASRWEQMAALGPRPGQYQGDASRARWHVTLAAVRAGWSPDEWIAAIPSWPWLASQLRSPRRLALARSEFEKAATTWSQGKTVQFPDTSQQFLHGGGAGTTSDDHRTEPAADLHRRLRQVRTWLAAQVGGGELAQATHAVARAVLFFAHATEAQRIQVGVRALAIAAATSRTTAGTALHTLAGLGLVTRVGRGIGRGADVWEINLELGDGLPPARGTIWATRPIFRILGGHSASEIYELLTTSRQALSSRRIAAALGRSPTTVTNHLNELLRWGLATGGGRGGWAVGPSDPDELAGRLGAHALVAAQVARFRAERLRWWTWLEAKGVVRPSRRLSAIGQVALLAPPTPQRPAPAQRGDRAGPDRAVVAAVSLVRRVFGGAVVSASPA